MVRPISILPIAPANHSTRTCLLLSLARHRRCAITRTVTNLPTRPVSLHASASTPLCYRSTRSRPYQGVGTVALVAVPSSGVFLTLYEGLKYALSGSSFLPPPAVHYPQ